MASHKPSRFQIYRRNFLARGLCPDCRGKEPLAPGRSAGRKCLAARAARALERFAERVKRGRCGNCGKEPVATTGLGLNCLRHQRERMRKRTGARRRWKSVSYALQQFSDTRGKTRKSKTPPMDGHHPPAS